MRTQKEKLNDIDDNPAKAIAYQQKVIPYFEKIRSHVDHLELHIDDELWTLPKYREMLFTM